MNECLSRDIQSESLESEGQVSLDFFWIPEGRGSENLGHLRMGLLVCDSGWSLAAQEFGSASTGDGFPIPFHSLVISGPCPGKKSRTQRSPR